MDFAILPEGRRKGEAHFSLGGENETGEFWRSWFG